MPRAMTPRIRTKRTLDVAPDLLMAEADDVERTSWNVLGEGQPPRFVLEVVTKESWERDTVEKWGIYNAMGVDEYAIFAPKRTDGGPLLFGHRRDADGDSPAYFLGRATFTSTRWPRSVVLLSAPSTRSASTLGTSTKAKLS